MKITIEIDSADIEKWRKRLNKAFDNPVFFETLAAAMTTPPFVDNKDKTTRKSTKAKVKKSKAKPVAN